MLSSGRCLAVKEKTLVVESTYYRELDHKLFVFFDREVEKNSIKNLKILIF